MAKLTLEELKNAIREEEERANEQADEQARLQRELTQAKIDTERARADKLRKDTHTNENRPPPKKSADFTTIFFLVSIGATITATIAFFVLLIIKGRF